MTMSDVLPIYLDRFEELRRSKRWTTDLNMLRFAALILTASDHPGLGAGLEEAARRLLKRAGTFGALNSPVRYAVAAMLLRRGLDIDAAYDRIEAVRSLFRQEKLKRGGIFEVLAALMLTLQAGEREVDVWTIRRMKEILERWKKDHAFLTGADDYPMAALHAARGAPPEVVGHRVEEFYQALRRERLARGNQLQLVSHLLAVTELGAIDAAKRFTELRRALKQAGIRTYESQYDEIAMLVMLGGEPEPLAARLAGLVDRLMSVRPRPQKGIAVSIGAGLMLAEAAGGIPLGETGVDLTVMRAVQAVIEAQQAAMVAIIASSAATTAATSG
jgi:hypothetical protein